jgi:hypothetical protein
MTTVSWKTIGHNWKVLSSDGHHIGYVFLVVGDDGEDIFDGLAITHEGHAFVWHNYVDRPRYASADQVASIDEGQVTLSVTADEARSLPLHDRPRAPASSLRTRRLGSVSRPGSSTRRARTAPNSRHCTG